MDRCWRSRKITSTRICFSPALSSVCTSRLTADRSGFSSKAACRRSQVRDLNIQKRENDLVVGTFGRGIYILDNYTPLRSIKPETLRQEAAVFPVKDALMYIQSQPLGGRGKSFQGERFYTADNPPFGATVTWYLKDAAQDAERETSGSGKRSGEKRRAGWLAHAGRVARRRRGRSAGNRRHDH